MLLYNKCSRNFKCFQEWVLLPSEAVKLSSSNSSLFKSFVLSSSYFFLFFCLHLFLFPIYEYFLLRCSQQLVPFVNLRLFSANPVLRSVYTFFFLSLVCSLKFICVIHELKTFCFKLNCLLFFRIFAGNLFRAMFFLCPFFFCWLSTSSNSAKHAVVSSWILDAACYCRHFGASFVIVFLLSLEILFNFFSTSCGCGWILFISFFFVSSGTRLPWFGHGSVALTQLQGFVFCCVSLTYLLMLSFFHYFWTIPCALNEKHNWKCNIN